MLKFVKRLALFVLVVFILPVLTSLAVWQADASKPLAWHQANWSSADILPDASEDKRAAIYVLSAKTGRWKGAFSVHSWIVLKEEFAQEYDRYDVVGWGMPVRQNAYPADARWYSNEPEIDFVLQGEKAASLIPVLRKAIENYPNSRRGDYVLWPGPNSNSFVAHLLNEVPEMGFSLVPNAVGRDWLSDGQWVQIDPDWSNIQVSLAGYAGFAAGRRNGIELNFLGLVAGIDFNKPGVKLPGFGLLQF